MSHDPILVATRKVRTGLLVVSTGAILFEIFGLNIDSLPALGLYDIPVDLMPVLLKSVISYQLISFLFRLSMDIANASDPNFYELSKKRVQRKQERFIQKHTAISTDMLIEHFREKFPDKQIFERQHRCESIYSLISHLVSLFNSGRVDQINDDNLAWQHAKDIEHYIYDESTGEGVYIEEIKIIINEMLGRLRVEVDDVYTGKWERSFYRWANIAHLWLFEFALPVCLGTYALLLLFS